MFMKLAKHRKFDYTPRIYDPKKKDQAHPQIEFRSMRRYRKSRSFIWLIILLFFMVYLIILLSKVAQNF